MKIPPYIHGIDHRLDNQDTQTVINQLPEPLNYEGDQYRVILDFPEVDILSRYKTPPNRHSKSTCIALFRKVSTINGKIWLFDGFDGI